MRKFYLMTAVAVSALLLATGCSSSEDAGEASESNVATVSFDIQADAAASTRAISDGTGANKLYYRVFDKDGNVISDNLPLKEEDATDLLTGHKVTIQLIKGQTYKIAFWAQNSSCSAYKVGNDMSVTVSYDNAANNDETRDAFCKTVEVTVTGDMVEDVTLTRPFAQINVGSTTKDWNDAVASGLTLKTSTVTIKDAATSLNVVTGKVTGSQDVTYTDAAIPNEKLQVDADGDGTKEDYHYLSMCYILPNESTTGANKTTVSTSFTFSPESGKGNPVTLDEGLQAIPVQRNYRTNIVGRILTGEVNFNVVIDPNYICDRDVNYALPDSWDGTTYTKPTVENGAYQINTAAELAWIFKQGSIKYSLSINNNLNMGNHEFYGRISIDADNLELNGNNHTISFFKLVNNSSNHSEDYSMGMFNGDALQHDFSVKDIQFKDVSAINDYTGTDASYGYAGILFGDIQNGRTVNFTNVKIHNGDLYGGSAIGSLVGLVAVSCTVNIDKCEVKCGILSDRDGSEAGYVGGLVGRPNISKRNNPKTIINIKNSKVWNTIINGFYSPLKISFFGIDLRDEYSIDAIVGDRTGGSYKSCITIDDATVSASTGEEANNYVSKTKHQ